MNMKKFFAILLLVWAVAATVWVANRALNLEPAQPQNTPAEIIDVTARCDALAQNYGEVSTVFVDRVNDLVERVMQIAPENLHRVDMLVPTYGEKLSGILQEAKSTHCDLGRFVSKQMETRRDIISPAKRHREYFPQGEFNQTKYCSEINSTIRLYASWQTVFNSDNIAETDQKMFLLQLFENQPPFAAVGHVSLAHDYLYLFTQKRSDVLKSIHIAGLTEQQIRNSRIRTAYVADIFDVIVKYQWLRHQVFDCPVDV